MKLRIAMLCHNYPPHTGGLEVMVQSLSRHLASRHSVAVVTSAWGDAKGGADEDGITVLRLPALHFLERLGVPYPVPTGPHIDTALRTLRNADVIHVHGALYPTSILGAVVARRGAKPLVVTEHVGFVAYEAETWNRIERVAWTLIGDRVIQRAARVTT